MNELETRQELLRSHFSDQDLAERTACIRTVRSAVKSFEGAKVAAANALAQIRDKKLYWPHANLKEFCKAEFDWSEQRAQQVIRFSEVRSALPDKVKPLVESERQARELVKVPEEQRPETLDQAKRIFSKDGEITAKSIREAAAEVGGIRDLDGQPVPWEARKYWDRRSEVQEILTLASKLEGLLNKIVEGDPLYVGTTDLQGKAMNVHKIFNQFKGCLPAHVCPVCDGKDIRKCDPCNHTGVVSEYVWKNMPPEYRGARAEGRRSQDPF